MRLSHSYKRVKGTPPRGETTGCHMRGIVVRGDAWPVSLSPCNAHQPVLHPHEHASHNVPRLQGWSREFFKLWIYPPHSFCICFPRVSSAWHHKSSYATLRYDAGFAVPVLLQCFRTETPLAPCRGQTTVERPFRLRSAWPAPAANAASESLSDGMCNPSPP